MSHAKQPPAKGHNLRYLRECFRGYEARILGTLVLSRHLDVLGPAGMFGLDRLGESGVVALLVGSLLGLCGAALAASYASFRRLPIT